MKIAIVNDLTLACETLRRVVSRLPEHEVIWCAKDGAEAVKKARAQQPDIILMDLIMPVMDGVEATRRIMSESPCAILIVTATVSGNSSKVYEAMSSGALDAVATPTFTTQGGVDGGEALLRKIGLIASLTGQRSRHVDIEPQPPASRGPSSATPLLLIGASTGGPQATADVISRLPKNFPASIVLVQHVDAQFASGLAAWLQEKSPLPVQIANNREELKPGTVYVASTNDHLILRKDLTLGYTPHPTESHYRPSIDVFFKSVAALWRGKGCAILLTGMGRDGAEGLLALRKVGFHTIAQDKNSSIVYGMPKAAAEVDAADTILPISLIGDTVKSYFSSTKT